MAQVADALPGIGRLRRYERRWLAVDLVAGVTVAAYLIPQVMGYATVAGVPVVIGLWSLIAALTVYVFVGSSPQLSVGPESTTALMTATVIAPLAAGDASRYVALVAALAIVVGLICAVGRVARLGFLADLLSQPVLVGYMAGLAVVMIVGQLERLTGVPVDGDTVVNQLDSFVQGLDAIHWPTAALGAALLTFLLIAGHFRPRWPVSLVGVLLATTAVAVWSLDRHGIRLVGTIPGGPPPVGLPDVAWRDIVDLALPAVGVAIVAFSDNALTARAFATRNRYEVSANQELAALGAANVASSLVGGFPVSSSASRTAIADSMGSTRSMCSLVAVAATAIVILVGRGVLGHFPSAALGAVVCFAAIKLIDLPGFRRLARFRPSELVLALATTVAVLAAGVLYGVIVAVALSIVDLVRRVARPHDGVLGYVPGVAGMHDIDDYPTARLVPGLIVYRYDAPLCFINAENFRERALESLDLGDGHVEWFVLNAEANVELDSTSFDALEALRAELEQRGIVFAMARVKQEIREVLDRAGFLDQVGAELVFATLPTAVDAYREWYRAQHGNEPDQPATSA